MLTSDWHTHSRNSCDGACIPVAHLLARAAEKGIADLGLTDHLHTPYNLPDIEASRREWLACAPSPRIHFGIEVSCVSQWELDEIAAGRADDPVYGLRQGGPPAAPPAIGLTQQNKTEFDIEFVVAGTHWPLYVPVERDSVIRDYHRQNMFLATHPLVDIVAHPWWWMGKWQDPDGMYRTDPWFDNFGKIPSSMHEEFAAAAREHDTIVEINLSAMLLNRGYPEAFKHRYLNYLAFLKNENVTLCLGSDCHDADYQIDFDTAEQMLESVGIRDQDLWRLPPNAVDGAIMWEAVPSGDPR